MLFLSFLFLAWIAILKRTTSSTAKLPLTSMPPLPLSLIPSMLSDPTSACNCETSSSNSSGSTVLFLAEDHH